MPFRPPANEPGALNNNLVAFQPRRIKFLHPGYPGNAALLLLPALDGGGADDGGGSNNNGGGGIDFDTALVACGLIAGNRWSDGFFSSDRSGAVIVERPEDGILREPQYFFQLPGPLDPPYPIVPRFSDWRFPHHSLPPLWQRWATDAAVTRAGGDINRRCVLSNYTDGLETAHLIPVAEKEWWLLNEMDEYSLTYLFSSNPIDGPANVIALRADLHRVFDERHFCPVVKVEEVDGERDRAATEPKPLQLVCHVFNSTPGGQLPGLWHNRVVHPLPTTVKAECLFARFAWTILSPRIFGRFLSTSPIPIRLLLWSRETQEWEVEDVSPEMCRKIWENTRSRSPKKRGVPTPTEAAEELLAAEGFNLFDGASSSETDSSENGGFYADELLLAGQEQGEEPRGRPLKRRCSLEQDAGRFWLRRKMLA